MDTYGMPAPAADRPPTLDARLPATIALGAEGTMLYGVTRLPAVSWMRIAAENRKQEDLKQLKQQIDRRT